MRVVCLWLSLLTPALAEVPAPDRELDLAAAVALFHEEAPTLDQIASRVAEAQATVRLSTAPLQPILATQAGYARNNAEVKLAFGDILQNLSASFPIPITIDPSTLPDPVIIQPLQQFSVGAQLTVPLFDGKAWMDFATARQYATATEAQAEGARLQTEAALVKACWLASAAEAAVHDYGESVKDATAQEERAARRVKGGLGIELDVLQAHLEVERRESALVQAEADLQRARRAIGALLGVGGAVRVAVPEVPRGVMSGDDAAATARADSPTLAATAAASTAADRAVDSAWWRHAPTLNATAQVAWQTVDFPTGLPYGWKVGLNLTWVLYDGGSRYAILDQALARRVGMDAQGEAAALEVDRTARDAVDAVHTADARVALAEAAVATAERAVVAASRAYDAGVVTSLDVLDAQQRLLDARTAVAGAKAQVGVAGADLALALGRAAGDL
jgi:outer membrane protein TolC